MIREIAKKNKMTFSDNIRRKLKKKRLDESNK